jgi:hypothetical protein
MLVCVLLKTVPNKLNKLENAFGDFVSYIKDYNLSSLVSFFKRLHLMREMAFSPTSQMNWRVSDYVPVKVWDTSLRNKIQTLSSYYKNDT